jgi:hypothetical protein
MMTKAAALEPGYFIQSDVLSDKECLRMLSALTLNAGRRGRAGTRHAESLDLAPGVRLAVA